jgi:uncharacterized protein (TIGR02246 family)
MKKTALVLFAVIVFGDVALAQTTPQMSDNQLVEKVIENWNQGWQKKDAKLAAKDYAEDADWTNAFGMKKKGRSEIETFLSEVFSLSFVMGAQSRTVEQMVRTIRPDVALVMTRVERVGQRTPTGAELGTRQTSHLRVLVKVAGEWKITSHLISDARDPERREH